jgi:urate oxidase
MTAEPSPARPGTTRIGQNQYGKAEVRVVRVVRDGGTHHLRDLNVSVALSGAMDDVHRSGSNANVLPTDTTKNTVYAFAQKYGVASPEDLAIRLARHFVGSQDAIHTARIRVEEYAWDRIGPQDTGHSFVRDGRETRTTEVRHDGEGWQVVSGLKDMVVLNTTDSEFWGYAKDRYTTLKEAYDRILATEVEARWRYAWSGDDRPAPSWDEAYTTVRGHLLDAFAQTYSLSLQQTLYSMGSRVIEHTPGVDEVRLSLPNKHHFLVDLAPFGLENDNEVYFAADRPYGLIEGSVLREGATPAIPVTD